MTKSELLKMRAGKYLLTDSICNYTYIMHRTDKDGHIAMLHSVFSKSGTVHFFYGLIQSFDDEYDKYIPMKRMDVSSSVGGISVNQKGCFSVLNNLQLVGEYKEGSYSEDLNRFRINHVINMCKYDKKTFRQIKGKRR